MEEKCMIVIIRHGQTELNKRKLLQGRSDFPLDAEGIEQTRRAAKLLSNIRFDRVYSSPLRRAVQTAEIVAPYVDALIDERLTEMDYGPYEGTDLNDLPPEIMSFFADFVHCPAPDGMEQLSSVVGRAGDFIEEIRNIKGNILISTHAIAMKGILEYLTPGADGAYWSKYIGNCGIYAAENENGKISVPVEWNMNAEHSG